jgi:sugar O-acyltransferase (sialic acid O-acetyltransferase NeuD family)
MKKSICIFGSGGFAKEVFWLARQAGEAIDAFIDIQAGGFCCDTLVKDEDYFDPSKHLAVVGVGSPKVRAKIVNNIISHHGEDVFATLISPSANIMSYGTITIGKGCVICANCILTCDITLGDFSQLNLSTTIGHDTKTGSFFTTAPGVHVNGKVNIGDRVYFGSNASTVEDISICDDVTIGAAACISKDIMEPGTYVGVPAKKLEKKNG